MQPEEIATVCETIRGHYRDRLFAMRQRIRAENALGGHIRMGLGWSKDMQTSESKPILAHARALIDHGHAALKNRAGDPPEQWDHYGQLITVHLSANAAWVDEEARSLKAAAKLAKTLPIWAFASEIDGFGENGLATIIGEAGNLSDYDRESKLWKRMGVAVIGPGDGINDHRQGNPGPKATADDWTAEGYNKFRRSRLYAAIAEPLLKRAETSRYRAIYLRRKAYEIERAEQLGLKVAPSAIIPKGHAHEYRSAMAIHRRAHRYMEKRLLRHLWRAWNGSGLGLRAGYTATSRVPEPSEIREAA